MVSEDGNIIAERRALDNQSVFGFGVSCLHTRCVFACGCQRRVHYFRRFLRWYLQNETKQVMVPCENLGTSFAE